MACEAVSRMTQRVRVPLAMGAALVSMAHSAEVQVELQIPESQIWEAREYQQATFAPAARPKERITLDALTIHPSSMPAMGRNVFVARSTSFQGPRNGRIPTSCWSSAARLGVTAGPWVERRVRALRKREGRVLMVSCWFLGKSIGPSASTPHVL